MKTSLFWRVVGAGAVLGLIAIGYGLGKNSQLPSTSFSSTAYADETSPKAKPADEEKMKMPELAFKRLNTRFDIFRAKVPGGWLLIYRSGGNGEGGLTFYPDKKHEWNGGKHRREIRRSKLRAKRPKGCLLG